MIMINKLIRCTACNQVIPNYQGYELIQAESLPGVEWSDADRASVREFLRTHFGHTMEELLVEEDSWVSEKPSYEPLRVSYCLAGNADRRFLIRRTKSTFDQPASYEIVPERMKITNVSIKFQENDFRKQIVAEKGFSALLKERMEKFIQVFQDEIARISRAKIEEEIEEIDDREGCLLAYAGLNNSCWEKILNRCLVF
jgi:hypothetical protein